jgi:hypothetical protein
VLGMGRPLQIPVALPDKQLRWNAYKLREDAETLAFTCFCLCIISQHVQAQSIRQFPAVTVAAKETSRSPVRLHQCGQVRDYKSVD